MYIKGTIPPDKLVYLPSIPYFSLAVVEIQS